MQRDTHHLHDPVSRHLLQPLLEVRDDHRCALLGAILARNHRRDVVHLLRVRDG